MDQRRRRISNLTEKTRERKQAWNSSLDSIKVKKILPQLMREKKKLTKCNKLNSSYSLLKFYASRSTIHGVKYIFDPKLHLFEKIIWLIFVIIFIFFTVNVFIIIVKDFQAAPTEVIIESTSHRVSFLPFPSVTICPSDRVDWKKVLNLEKNISNSSEVIENYRKLVTVLGKMAFVDLYKLGFLNNTKHEELLRINATELMFNIVPDCKDLLKNCWWRNVPQNCCEIFQIQKTEYGICYSFNSLVSENPTESKVRKVTAYGSRSGLMATIELGDIMFPPNKYRYRTRRDSESGILISINDPLVWPKVVNKIMVGSIANVNVKCTSGYASEDVLNLSPSKMPCRLKDLRTNIRYSQETCISECRREHAIKYCACNPSFFFASENTTTCTINDLKCLHVNDDKFITYQNLGDENFQEGAEDIMTCDCPPACDYYNYEVKLLSVSVASKNISLDVHYEGPVGTRYKMNVVTTGLKLLVNFGGVFGLFVGGSIISLIEPVYLFLRGIFCRLYIYIRRKTKERKKSSSEHLKLYLSEFPQMKPTFTTEFYVPKERY
ncbi:pickpocket protein 19-like [Leptopilina heterotoma]|uniref:pickpocket protein 19-like n=1 Tax=Leptopilina heterotoma TaxID=63436 RepID=UPI001CA87D1B|nr:pickpocket protein 19-like [Leptopilina heterotoma]